jgi:hypothetical protein
MEASAHQPPAASRIPMDPMSRATMLMLDEMMFVASMQDEAHLFHRYFSH